MNYENIPDHISFSQVNTYLICPLRYRFQYIDREEWQFKPAALTLGSAIHAAIEKYYTNHLESKRTSLTDLQDIFDTRLYQDCAEVEMKFKTGKDPVEIQQQGHAMLDCFLENVTPGDVLGVEEKFTLNVVDGETGETLDVPLVGRVDLIERTEDGNIVFVDYKTASTRYSEDSVQRNLQLTAYSLWAREAYSTEKNEVIHLRFDVLLKNKTPLHLKYQTQRTYQDAQRFVRMLLMISEAIREEHFYPNPGWQCADCPFKVACVADPLM